MPKKPKPSRIVYWTVSGIFRCECGFEKEKEVARSSGYRTVLCNQCGKLWEVGPPTVRELPRFDLEDEDEE